MKDQDDAARPGAYRAGIAEEPMNGTDLDLQTISAEELLATEFPELSWIVPGLIPEGLFLLAGRPKIGKSWLALLLAACKAATHEFLGRALTSHGEVLYLALEDSRRRIKRRLLAMGFTQAPKGLHFLFKVQKIGNGGLKAIERWLDRHPDVQLVIIDTYAKIRDPKPRNAEPYQYDVDQAGLLQELATRRGISLIVVHHDRKAGADDWLETISGTLGLTGTADAVALLERDRDSANARFRITGRDIEDQDLALLFQNCKWTAIGDGAQLTLTPERQKILNFLSEKGEQSPTTIHLGTGLSVNTIKSALPQMRDFVSKTKHGRWKAN